MDFTYEVIKTKRKTICIEITRDDVLLVRAPLYLSDDYIKKFVREHEKNIERLLLRAEKRKEAERQAEIEATGNAEKSAENSSTTSPNFHATEINLAFQKPHSLTPSDIKKMKTCLLPVITKKCDFYAGVLGVNYRKITIRTERSVWGSCTRTGNLNFNVLLSLAPENVLNYVIVHELSHRKQMNHSKKFWAIVESVIPDYKEDLAWLKKNGKTLINCLPEGEKNKNFYTYILKCADNTYYTGYTVDLEKRITAHNTGRGAKYTARRTPVSLVYYETFSTKSAAMRREAEIKYMKRADKEKLIASKN